MRKSVVVLGTLVLFAHGCVMRGKLPTPSGRPEILLPASQEEAHARIVGYLHSRQYQVEQGLPTLVVGTKDLSISTRPEDKALHTHSAIHTAFGLSGYGNLRSTFSLVKDPTGGTRVYLTEHLYSVNGFGAEQRSNMEGQDGLDMSQAKLEEIASTFVPEVTK